MDLFANFISFQEMEPRCRRELREPGHRPGARWLLPRIPPTGKPGVRSRCCGIATWRCSTASSSSPPTPGCSARTPRARCPR
ncbi:hypothetical protein HBB16_08460 [Pseudonocardia sp. MCCB 268]|nr:hypothetical protein [Pseudonocardia cytotoxica]